MKKIHMILQGKGGVGKSFAASLLAQYKMNKGKNPLCIDTDPVNSTFHDYKALNVHRLEIMEKNEINSRSFDALVELTVNSKEDVIIDNGATSFVPLSHYLLSNEIPFLLKENGGNLMVHTIITGGQALMDTLNGFEQLVSQFSKEIPFVVWLNPYWGIVEYEGKNFEQLKVYEKNQSRISAMVQIPLLKPETFGRDLSDMLQDRLTFDEALAQSERTIMTRQRLKIIRDQIFSQLDSAAVL